MKRVSTNECRHLVERREEFSNHSESLRGHWQSFAFTPGGSPVTCSGSYERGRHRQYVVWTYSEPLFVYDEESDQWFGNSTRYSRTSSKHKGCAQPHCVEIKWRERNVMREITNNGLAGAVRQRFKEAA
jgi:hypothetical protein